MKLNIHKKVLILVLGAGLTTFLVLGIFSYFGERIVQRDMEAMSVELGEKSASYTDDLLTDQLKQTLGELAKAKAQFIDREMSITKEDALVLANAMTEIMSHPENYAPKTLPDPRTDPVKQGEPYRIYAPDIRDNLTPEILQEHALASNIRDLLAELLKGYTGYNATAFVGGEKGWYICARLVRNENGDTDFNATISFSYERIYEFDPRKRPWYVAAKNAGEPVISDLYGTVETSGAHSYQQIGASAPFYDAQGNMIGVAGLDSSNEDIYNEINTLTSDKGSINFVLNERGEVIFSSQNSGVLAVNTSDDLVARSGGRDLRQSDERTIAHAAWKMVGGEHGVLPIVLNGKNFYRRRIGNLARDASHPRLFSGTSRHIATANASGIFLRG